MRPSIRLPSTGTHLFVSVRGTTRLTGCVRRHCQPFVVPGQGENSMQADLVSFGIDLFDLDDEVQGAAQDWLILSLELTNFRALRRHRTLAGRRRIRYTLPMLP